MKSNKSSSISAQEKVFIKAERLERKLLRKYNTKLTEVIKDYEHLIGHLFTDGELDEEAFRKFKRTRQYQEGARKLRAKASNLRMDGEQEAIQNLLEDCYSLVLSEVCDLDDMPCPINQPWATDGKNFTERLSANSQLLGIAIATTLVEGLDKGVNIDKQKKLYAKSFGKGANNVKRIIETETEAFYSKALQDGYLSLGYTEVIIHNDADPCGGCSSLEGSHKVSLEDAQVGIDLPPFHPYCRCVFSVE